jgi:hypothetical protein
MLVPTGTSKSMLRRHGIQAVTRVMAYVADAVIVFNNAYWRLRDIFEGTDVINLEMTASNTVWLKYQRCCTL